MAVIIFKPIEKCNANCVYCPVIEKNNSSIMDFETLSYVFIRINEYLLNHPKEEITLTWHGGEVCLLGADYFNKAYDMQENYCPTTKKRIKHRLQSNVTLINQDLINIFKKLGIDHIGTSYEVLPNIRGIGSKRNSKRYTKKFLDGIDLLKKNNLSYGYIYVVNKHSLNYPKEIFYHLTNLNFNSPSFNKLYIYGENGHELNINQKEYAEFLCEIFPLWWNNIEMYPNVSPFINFYRSIINNKNQMKCEFSGHCAYKWMSIDPDGETSHCGRMQDFEVVSYGNIKKRKISDILTDNKRDYLSKRNDILYKTECKECRFWEICHGGCPLDAYMTYGDFMHKTPNCEWITYFLENCFEPTTNLKFNFDAFEHKQNNNN